jgi:hypothetical protein
MQIVFDKTALSYILGDFFTNSSGHPASMDASMEACVMP